MEMMVANAKIMQNDGRSEWAKHTQTKQGNHIAVQNWMDSTKKSTEKK